MNIVSQEIHTDVLMLKLTTNFLEIHNKHLFAHLFGGVNQG